MTVVLDDGPTYHWFGLPAEALSGPKLTGTPFGLNRRSRTPDAVEPVASDSWSVVLPGFVRSVSVTKTFVPA